MNNELIDNWMEVHRFIDDIEMDIEDSDYYELEDNEFNKIKDLMDNLKEHLNIKTGRRIVRSLTSKNYYCVNIWIEKDGLLIHTLSKRPATEEEIKELKNNA